MDNLTWLTQWFADRIDGEWESEYGVSIETVNNPGWMVRIDLDGTGLNPATFKPLAQQRTETDWVECKVNEGTWLGGGGIANLDEVLGIFRAWVERLPRSETTDRRPPQRPQQRPYPGPPRGEKRPWKKR